MFIVKHKAVTLASVDWITDVMFMHSWKLNLWKSPAAMVTTKSSWIKTWNLFLTSEYNVIIPGNVQTEFQG